MVLRNHFLFPPPKSLWGDSGSKTRSQLWAQEFLLEAFGTFQAVPLWLGFLLRACQRCPPKDPRVNCRPRMLFPKYLVGFFLRTCQDVPQKDLESSGGAGGCSWSPWYISQGFLGRDRRELAQRRTSGFRSDRIFQGNVHGRS